MKSGPMIRASVACPCRLLCEAGRIFWDCGKLRNDDFHERGTLNVTQHALLTLV